MSGGWWPDLPLLWSVLAAWVSCGLMGFYLGVVAGRRWAVRGRVAGSMRGRLRRFREVSGAEREVRRGADFRYRFALRGKGRGGLGGGLGG